VEQWHRVVDLKDGDRQMALVPHHDLVYLKENKESVSS